MDNFEAKWAFQKERGVKNAKQMFEQNPEMFDAHMTWKFSHLEVDYKVSFWGIGSMCDGMGMWNYYLYLREDQFGAEAFRPLWLEPKWQTLGGSRLHETYDYYISPFTELDMHGGITFYKRHGDGQHTSRAIEIGCDFGHLFDADYGYDYDLSYVKCEAQSSIDKLRKIYPNLLVKCNWDGTYHPRDEMIQNKNGSLIWSANKEKIPVEYKWFEGMTP